MLWRKVGCGVRTCSRAAATLSSSKLINKRKHIKLNTRQTCQIYEHFGFWHLCMSIWQHCICGADTVHWHTVLYMIVYTSKSIAVLHEQTQSWAPARCFSGVMHKYSIRHLLCIKITSVLMEFWCTINDEYCIIFCFWGCTHVLSDACVHGKLSLHSTNYSVCTSQRSCIQSTHV